jgi:hypothetical protein
MAVGDRQQSVEGIYSAMKGREGKESQRSRRKQTETNVLEVTPPPLCFEWNEKREGEG